MGNISLPISKNNKVIGSLILEDVLIVPNLDRRLFSVNAFLSKGHNWVHFSRHMIKLGIKDGPCIQIPITSLQSNTLVVEHNHKHKEFYHHPNKKKRKKQKRFVFELFNIFDIHMEVNYVLRLIIIDFITNGLVNIQEI